MKNLALLILGILFTCSLSAQDASKGQYKGYVILKDGKKTEGVLDIRISDPWTLQRNFHFIEMKKFNPDKKLKKKDMKKYTTKDVIEYGFEGRVFKKIKYNNVTAAAKNLSNQKTGRMAKISSGVKNMKSSYFAEVISAGESMSVYKFFTAPSDVYVASGSEQINEMDRLEEDARNNYDVLVALEEEGAKSFSTLNIKKYFKSCDFVMKKFNNSEYKRKPTKGAVSAVKNSNILGDELADTAAEIVADYNANCGN